MYIVSRFIEQERWEAPFSDLSHLNFSLFNEYQPSLEELNKNPINILVIGSEPNEYFGNHDYAIQNYHLFSVILTWSTKILNQVPNAFPIVFGESWWQDKPYEYEEAKKEFKISFLRGNLLKMPGHFIRHEVYARQNEFNIPIQFWDVLGNREDNFEKKRQDKISTFTPYQFSLCIENSSRDNYFSEKITDCILHKTIPIYWGCSNIEYYYNSKGIIQVKNADEIIRVVNSLTPDYYNDRLDIINENYQQAFKYKDYISNIKNHVLEIFKVNSIK
jgi:hypothetical protein